MFQHIIVRSATTLAGQASEGKLQLQWDYLFVNLFICYIDDVTNISPSIMYRTDKCLRKSNWLDLKKQLFGNYLAIFSRFYLPPICLIYTPIFVSFDFELVSMWYRYCLRMSFTLFRKFLDLFRQFEIFIALLLSFLAIYVCGFCHHFHRF